MTEKGDKEDAQYDFAAAKRYLKIAREAYEAGDQNRFTAARKLIAVALGIEDRGSQRA